MHRILLQAEALFSPAEEASVVVVVYVLRGNWVYHTRPGRTHGMGNSSVMHAITVRAESPLCALRECCVLDPTHRCRSRSCRDCARLCGSELGAATRLQELCRRSTQIAALNAIVYSARSLPCCVPFDCRTCVYAGPAGGYVCTLPFLRFLLNALSVTSVANYSSSQSSRLQVARGSCMYIVASNASVAYGGWYNRCKRV